MTPVEPPTLPAAVESGDLLAILKAPRRNITQSPPESAGNTRPPFPHQPTQLNGLIREEESRRSVEDEDSSVVAPLEAQAWNGTGY